MEEYKGESSKYAGETVKIVKGQFAGSDYKLEDWWMKLTGKSWMISNGNPACLNYAIRSGLKDKLPNDNNVYYGKIGSYGHLIHASEIQPHKE